MGLILLDHELKEGSGVEVAKEIRGKGIREVAIVMCSGNAGIEEKYAGEETGIDMFVEKPLYIEKVRHILAQNFY